MHPLKNIFNKIFWDRRERPENFEVTFIHRGAKGDVKTIPANSIKKVGASWLTYSDQGEETLIPYHRITEVRNVRTDQVLWVSKKSRL